MSKNIIDAEELELLGETLEDNEPKIEVSNRKVSKKQQGFYPGNVEIVDDEPKVSEKTKGNEIMGMLASWISGDSPIPDKEIATFLKGTKEKAELTNSFIVQHQMSKLAKFSDFADTAEALLFNKENLKLMENKDIVYMYNLALNRISDIMRMNERHINETSGADDEMQRIATIVKSLTPDQVKNLLKFVKTMKDEGGNIDG